MGKQNFISKNMLTLVTVIMLSMGLGASAMGGIERYASSAVDGGCGKGVVASSGKEEKDRKDIEKKREIAEKKLEQNHKKLAHNREVALKKAEMMREKAFKKAEMKREKAFRKAEMKREKAMRKREAALKRAEINREKAAKNREAALKRAEIGREKAARKREAAFEISKKELEKNRRSIQKEIKEQNKDIEREMDKVREEISAEMARVQAEVKRINAEAFDMARRVADTDIVAGFGNGLTVESDSALPGEESGRISKAVENAARSAEYAARAVEEIQAQALQYCPPVNVALLIAGDNGAVEIAVEEFDRISVSDCVEVEYREGVFPGTIEVLQGTDGIKDISATVEQGLLSLRYKGEGGIHGEKIRIRVTAPAISSLSLFDTAVFTAIGGVDVEGGLSIDTYGATVASFGDISGDLLNIVANSASRVFALSVDVDSVRVDAASASNVRLKGLNADDVKACAASASQVVLGGRCNTLTTATISEGMVNTKGLITGPGVRTSPEKGIPAPSRALIN